MIDASVVIATRDRADLLRDCLHRLAAQSAHGAFETIVVDNGSADATASVVADAAAGGAVRRIFVPEPNRGKARNAGIAAATGRIVIFIDDDTLPPPAFVASHLRAHAAYAKSVVSGPIVNVADADHLSPASARNYSRAFLCTCNASVERADLEAVGGFDERYDLYGWEDTDLGVRLRERGVRRAWSWEALIYHVKPPSTATLQSRRALAKQKGEMAARFVRKSPTMAVKLATGAFALNFARATIVGSSPMRRWFERIASGATGGRSPLARLAADALVDAAYVDALRAGLRRDD
jgi:GT2 family glycosyltransferase